jgi:hypothetical protein
LIALADAEAAKLPLILTYHKGPNVSKGNFNSLINLNYFQWLGLAVGEAAELP